MTIADVKACGKDFLSPADVASVLHCRPYSITRQAKDAPYKLGFPVTVIGTRVKIPRVAFLQWAEGKETEHEQPQRRSRI